LLSPISAAPTNESKCTGHHDEVAKSMWPSISAELKPDS
jgi:hypothetical protein